MKQSMEQNPMKIIRDIGRLMLIGVPLLTVAMISSCSQEEDIASGTQTRNRLMLKASLENDWTEVTRGQKVTYLEEAFGLFAYNYSDTWGNGNDKTANWLCNQEVTTTEDSWVTTSLVDLDETENYFQFFAYYPYLHDEFSANDEFKYVSGPYTINNDEVILKTGNPAFNFVTAENAVEQVDFLVGVSLQKEKSTLLDNPVQLKFKHALAAVQFKVGTFNESMTINKIELTSVKKNGIFTITPPTDNDYSSATMVWSSLDEIGSIYTEPAYKVANNNSDQGAVINSGNLVLFLIPQTLPNDATILVTVNDEMTLSAKINPTTDDSQNAVLKQGCITTFTLSVSSMQRLSIETSIVNWGQSEDQIFNGDGKDGNSVTPTVQSIDDWTPVDPQEGNLGGD